jgi:hypothetical protein
MHRSSRRPDCDRRLIDWRGAADEALLQVIRWKRGDLVRLDGQETAPQALQPAIRDA